MEAKLQRRVQRYGWDAAAKTYDATWRENLRPAHAAMFEMVALKPTERVVELACGSGFATFQAAELVQGSGHILATDISAEMVKLVQARARQLGFDHVTAERREAENLDLTAAGFDVAFCALGLMFLPEPRTALNEMYRALKPGGRAVAAVWGERRNCSWADIFPIIDNVVQSEVCPLFFALGTGDSLAEDFRSAGFTSVETRRLSTVLEFASEESLLAAIIEGGAVALAAKRFDAVTRQQVETEYLASIAAHRSGNAFELPAEFVVVVGHKPP
jgi:ubiquinone/menaquinone biosynthesis C-methylase UbiE